MAYRDGQLFVSAVSRIVRFDAIDDHLANPPALQTLRSKARPVSYPDGATFVVSIYEVVTADGITRAGPKRRDVG